MSNEHSSDVMIGLYIEHWVYSPSASCADHLTFPSPTKISPGVGRLIVRIDSVGYESVVEVLPHDWTMKVPIKIIEPAKAI